MDGIKFHLDPEHEDDLSPPDTTVKPQIWDPLQCKLDLNKVKNYKGKTDICQKLL